MEGLGGTLVSWYGQAGTMHTYVWHLAPDVWLGWRFVKKCHLRGSACAWCACPPSEACTVGLAGWNGAAGLGPQPSL